ncbi:MAG: carboxypeptidase regulatory-like domain-containing protein [Pseudomonadota bacterium]|nr:carboxypeptidase regulatory-like domain-containing protein [Pseudomonadota bacterium]
MPENNGQNKNFDYNNKGQSYIDFWFPLDFEKTKTVGLKHWVADVGVIGNFGQATGITWEPKIEVSCSNNSGGGNTPVMGVSPSQYNFGTITVGQTSTAQSFTVSNIGDADLQDITMQRDYSDEFEVVTNGCRYKTLNPNESCTFEVEFTPQAEGSHSFTLKIYSNAEKKSVELSGTGTSNNSGSTPPPNEPPPQTTTHAITLQSSAGTGTVELSYNDNSSKSGQKTITCPSECKTIDIAQGESVDVVATPGGNNYFEQWNTTCFNSTSQNANFSVQTSCSIQAVFKKNNNPPQATTIIAPTNGASEVLNTTLKWSPPPDDNRLKEYKVYLKANNDTFSDNDYYVTGSTYFTPPGQQLLPGTTYYWKIVPVDIDGLEASNVPIWSFTTAAVNEPPYPPVNDSPSNNSEEINPNEDITLTWHTETPQDPDNDAVTYQVYFGNLNQPFTGCIIPLSSTSCTIPAQQLEYEKSYFWQVVADDGHDHLERGDIWSFTTLGNNPPYEPKNPSLMNGNQPIAAPFDNVDQSLPIQLSWEGGDPDVGDVVTYTVSLAGCEATCEKALAETHCTIPAGTLDAGEICTWLVVAKDNHDKTRSSVMWQFTTQMNQPPFKASNPVLKTEDQIVDSEVDYTRPLTFSWQGNGDPEDDEVTYRVCYANLAEIDIVNLTDESCTPVQGYAVEETVTLPANRLVPDASYAWIVSVKDSHGNKSEWDVWTFETKPAPAVLTLDAYAGRSNARLKWTLEDEDSHKISEYRVLRVEGRNTEFDPTIHEIKRGLDEVLYLDLDELQDGQEYCYRIDALDEKGDLLFSSRIEPTKNCVEYGKTTIGVQSQNAAKGEVAGVPFIIPNGGGLKIATADICLGFEGDVLTVVEPAVKSNFFEKNYKPIKDEVYPVEGELLGLGKISNVIKISIKYDGWDEPDELPDELQGTEPLAEINLKVNEDTKKDSSILKLLSVEDNPTLQEDDFLKGCSYIFEDAAGEPVPLQLMDDSSFFVRKGLRTQRNQQYAPARLYVRSAYSKGDLNGDGLVLTNDVKLATGIGLNVKKYIPPTAEQVVAGDINIDGQINAIDAKLIEHYIFYQEWTFEDSKRKGRRDNGNMPIFFNINEIEGISGSEVTATLSVNNLFDLSAMDLAIAYDRDVIEDVVNVYADETGVAAGIEMSLDHYADDKGILRVSLYTTGSMPIEGHGDFLKITFRLASGGSVKSTNLFMGEMNLYNRRGRNFVTSILQRSIEKQHGKVVITDVEAPVIEEEQPISIKEMMPTVHMNQRYSASGTVTNNLGDPLQGATLHLDDQTTVTDSSGYWAIIGLTAGEYPVSATKGTDSAPEQTCVLANKENCQLDFVIDTGAQETVGKYAAYGTIRDQSGNPIPGVQVQVGDNTTTTDESGYWAIVGLVAGQYPVGATKDGYKFLSQTCTVDNDENCNVNIADSDDILPASCQLYAVHDQGLNRSQFFTVTLDAHQVNNLGPIYKGYDIEALAIHPQNDMIYAASGNDVSVDNLPGHLYQVDGQSGDLFPIGSTGFEEIGDLAFGPDGSLWGWAKHEGLIAIDLETAAGTLILPAHPDVLLEGLTLSQGAGTVFYGSANTDLWRYDLDNDLLEIVCSNLAGETEALEMLIGDVLLLGMHRDQALTLHALNPTECAIMADAAIPTDRFDDVEGIALPINACSP